MIEPKCHLPRDRSKIKFEENGRSAVFRNPLMGGGLVPIRVDGCVKAGGTSADYVIEEGKRAVVVELKGRDVEGAAKQVTVTTELWGDEFKRVDVVAGLIVARRYPRASSTIQIKQNNFRKKFLCPLHVVCQNVEYDFDAIFSFKPLQK